MLGLRLDEPVEIGRLEDALDVHALERLEELGLAGRLSGASGERLLALTRRGRFLGGAVTSELLA